jgi:dTMP kinase
MFITIEGPDQAGKTTQVSLLKKYAAENNKDWLFTSNPGGTDLGKRLRELILDRNYKVSDKAELLVYLADRAQHVEEYHSLIKDPTKVVICDRFTDSTLAYQGYGRNLDLGIIRQLNAYVTKGIKPDLTLMLMIDADEAARRREGAPDRIEQENKLFFIRIANGYKTIAHEEPERVKIINVENHSREVLHERIVNLINSFIEQGQL